MDKDEVYRFYGWRIEDGDYQPKELSIYGGHTPSRLEKFIDLLLFIFVMRNK
ncbi:MAG: hypothetical protein LWX07_06275 [Bacteroidetes bacterium]|nr:hypothetical protein [Bacteroidota bacterium]